MPTNALLVACLVPIALCLFVFWRPDSLARVTAFAVLGIYIAFEAVVLAALRQRIRGWRPAGLWNLGSAGMAVNVAALAYGIFAMFLLARPGAADTFIDRWIVVIGAILVLGTGLAYMLIAKPYDHSEGIPEGDAVEVRPNCRASASSHSPVEPRRASIPLPGTRCAPAAASSRRTRAKPNEERHRHRPRCEHSSSSTRWWRSKGGQSLSRGGLASAAALAPPAAPGRPRRSAGQARGPARAPGPPASRRQSARASSSDGRSCPSRGSGRARDGGHPD